MACLPIGPLQGGAAPVVPWGPESGRRGRAESRRRSAPSEGARTSLREEAPWRPLCQPLASRLGWFYVGSVEGVWARQAGCRGGGKAGVGVTPRVQLLPSVPFPYGGNVLHLLSLSFTVCCWSFAQRVQLFVTACTAARQASLSFTIFRSLLKLMSIESVMPSSHLILCRPLLLPSDFHYL